MRLANIPYDKVLGAKSMVRITVNPAKRSIRQLLLSGMLKIVDDVPKVLYNQNNSGLETITYLGPNFDVRINAAFDKAGDLWVTNSRVKTESKYCAPMGNGKIFN
jgi:hypothetical protein